MSAPQELLEALEPLWRLKFLAPQKLTVTPAFVRLRETCEKLYPRSGKKAGLGFALSHALNALGMPCMMRAGHKQSVLSVEAAAANLDSAFRKTHANRVHLCPLDCADDLPAFAFGENAIRTLSANEFEGLVDQPRLRRIFSDRGFDAKSFSEFTWLVIRESVVLDEQVGARTVPIFYQRFDTDPGAINPYQSAYPEAVENVLSFLMLPPWEDWAEYADIEWRCFRIPWIYTIDDDLFARPENPPLANTLSWEPDICFDEYGEELDCGQRPVRWNMNEQANLELGAWINDQTWSDFKKAKESPLFSSPILHFLLRGYRSNDIDEFLAHTTVIDAALGLHGDHRNRGATQKLVKRLSGLLDNNAGNEYKRLFNTRSEFVHGRVMETIPVKDRLLARSLARRATVALVKAAARVPDRERYLNDLLSAADG